MSEIDADALRRDLLAWYDTHARTMPWRIGPQDRAAGQAPDPYRIWLSEIMLQQTTVATVGPYFARFLERFPDVEALASAPVDDVLVRWAGLGYYARARNLHACAQAVMERFGGAFPADEAALRTLPGVGAYTSASLAAIAFDRPANVVDGNVERVMARLFRVEEPLPRAKTELATLAARFVTDRRAGDWAQALMDLGATICTPKSPSCLVCPISRYCAGAAFGDAASFPRKATKAERPRRFGVAFLLVDDSALWLRKRPMKGLLGGMTEVPTTPWRETAWTRDEAVSFAPSLAAWARLGSVDHVFSHFALNLDVWQASGPASAGGDGFAVGLDQLDAVALPSVMRKVVALAQV